MENREQKIISVAEQMVRDGGYNAFSFREIAKVVGIKSSSVHYYFPTKADLGAAMIKRFTGQVLEYLDEPTMWLKKGKDPIEIYTQSFRETLTAKKSMCIGGLLAAEAAGLPSQITDQTRDFFEKNIAWLEAAYTAKGTENAKSKAIQTVGLLEGAILMGHIMNDADMFDTIAQLVTQ